MSNAANENMDVLIRAAFERASVPDGAMHRCLAKLRSAADEGFSAQELEAPGQGVEGFVSDVAPAVELYDASTLGVGQAKSELRSSRRAWFAFAASVALAASIAFVSVAWLRTNAGLSADSIIAGAGSLAELNAAGQIDWQESELSWPEKATQELAMFDMQLEPIAHAAIPNRYFGSTRARVINVWKIRSHSSQRDGLWIEVDKTKQIESLLAVMKPLTNSGKWAVAAMQSPDGRLFVLVCQGDVSQFLRRTSFT